MKKPHLLYLVHRIPYPPDKGDKIRSFNFLKGLAEHYTIHLGCFYDDPRDVVHQPVLEDYCETIKILPLSKKKATIKSLIGLVTGEALTLPYYRNAEMKKWVKEVSHRYSIKQAFIFSAAMAQYIEDESYDRKIADFVDIDSDKWLQYAEQKKWPMSSVYKREGALLNRYEHKITGLFDKVIFVSKAEAKMFAEQLPDHKSKIDYVNNGVDYEYFSPDHSYKNPYPDNSQAIVFTGAMDYWANVDAVLWFCKQIFPHLERGVRPLNFYIVGSNPSADVKDLDALVGVTVTGRVEDIRPYVSHANLVVAPLRIARGVQNKVLEAMSFNQTIIATEMALEGIQHEGCLNGYPVDDGNKMIRAINDVINGHQNHKDYRSILQKNYSWKQNCKKLVSFLDFPEN
jgi:sugar transferase (PEP-CTERM/EpsH1 system associated)